jgi:hypothetical protein
VRGDRSVPNAPYLLINQGLPEGMKRRYDGLIAKRQAEVRNEQELGQLLHLTGVVEDLEASRMDTLAPLARSRGVCLGEIMADLGASGDGTNFEEC